MPFEGSLENLRGFVVDRGDVRIGSTELATVYSATQGALETLTRAWSAEFGASGVRVVGIRH